MYLSALRCLGGERHLDAVYASNIPGSTPGCVPADMADMLEEMFTFWVSS